MHHVHSGNFVEKGKILGHITDLFGNIITTYYAEQTGVVLYICPAFSAPKGTVLVAYGTIKNENNE